MIQTRRSTVHEHVSMCKKEMHMLHMHGMLLNVGIHNNAAAVMGNLPRYDTTLLLLEAAGM